MWNSKYYFSQNLVCETSSNLTDCNPFNLESTSSPQGPFHFKLFVYNIRETDGSGGETNQRIEEAIETLRSYFAIGNIFFEWDCHIENYDDSNLLNSDAVINVISPHVDAIDIYFFDVNREFSGQSGSAFSVGDHSAFRIGSQWLGEDYILTPYMAHEMGHVFSLFILIRIWIVL